MNAPHPITNSPERLRLSVEHFLLLDEGGAFADHAKAELIDGAIYVMNAQFHPHARAKTELTVALALRLREIDSDIKVVSEVSVRLNDDTLPEPDIILSRWRGRGPVPVVEVLLVIEVSDTTLETDLGRKAELYAAAGVPEYWVVDLNENRVLMHEHPEPCGYGGQLDVPLGAPLTAATIVGLEIGTAPLLD